MDVGFVGHAREGRRGSGAALRVREREGERWCRLSSSRHTFKNEKKEFIALSSSFLFVSLDSIVCHCPNPPVLIERRGNRFMHVCMHTSGSNCHRRGKRNPRILLVSSPSPFLFSLPPFVTLFNTPPFQSQQRPYSVAHEGRGKVAGEGGNEKREKSSPFFVPR
jgi:hypothetical protein